MKTNRLIQLLCLTALMATWLPPYAPAAENFSDFKVITDRNIFNPNRQPRSRFNTIRRGSTTAPRPTDSISLVGTLSYEKGDFAFFDGTSSEFRKSAKPGESVAGFTIIVVGTNYVKLGQSNDVILVSIGTVLRRDTEGNWTIPDSAYVVGGRSRRNSAWQRDYGSNRPSVEAGAKATGPGTTNDMSSADLNAAGQDMAQPEVMIIGDETESISTIDSGQPNGENNPTPVGEPNDPLTRLMQQRALEEQQLHR